MRDANTSRFTPLTTGDALDQRLYDETWTIPQNQSHTTDGLRRGRRPIFPTSTEVFEHLEDRRLPRPFTPLQGLAKVVAELRESAEFSLPERGRPSGLAMEGGAAFESSPRCSDPHLIRFIRAHAQGLIEIDSSRVSAARLIAQAALAYPHASIGVATAGRRSVDRFARDLRSVGFTPSHETLNNAQAKRRVGLFSDFAQDSHSFHLMFFPEARHIAHERAKALLLSADFRAALFGFRPAARRESKGEWTDLVNVFGLESLAISRHGTVGRRVWTMFTPHDAPPAAGRDAGSARPLPERELCWRDPARNRRVAAKAVSCSAELQKARRVGAVVVAVESAEHFRELTMRGPLRQAAPLLGDAEPGERPTAAARSLPPRGDANLVVATVSGLRSASPFAVEAVLWAGAGRAAPALPNWLLESTDAAPSELLLIDLADRWSESTRRSTRLRRADYESRRWFRWTPERDEPARAFIRQRSQ